MYFNKFFLEDIVNFSKLKGVDPIVFEHHWKEVRAVDEQRVDYDSVVRFVQTAVGESGDESFGLHLGEYFLLKATESVDSIMEASQTLEEAFSNAVEYSKLISDSMECELVKLDNLHFSVTFKNNPDWEIRPLLAKRHNLEAALVSAVKSLQFLTGFSYFPTSIKLPYPRTKILSEYYRIFNCPIVFNHSFAEITFDRNLLSKKVQTSDYGLLQSLKANAEKEIAELKNDDPLILNVKRAILQHMGSNTIPGQEMVAESLTMTTRTLQRRLKERKVSFIKLLTDAKLELALRHLEDNNMKIEEAAYLSGYSEPSSFSRAFKKWKGVTPKKYLST